MERERMGSVEQERLGEAELPGRRRKWQHAIRYTINASIRAIWERSCSILQHRGQVRQDHVVYN